MKKLHEMRLVCFSNLFLVSCFCVPWISDAIITSHQPIKDGETITSSSGNFALGFFSPANTSNRYVGIWYNSIPQLTVIWVANRETPVTDSSGSLLISGDGNLVIIERRNRTIWSSNVSSVVPDPANVTGELMDTGNFVLRNNQGDHGNASFLWESFDFPTDTFVPGMKLKLDLRSSKSTLIRSWKAADDPSVGALSFGMQSLGQHLVELALWNYSHPYWRGGIWNGFKSFGFLDGNKAVSYLALTDQGDEIDMTISPYDTSILTRLVVLPSGLMTLFVWQKGSRWWDEAWKTRAHTCLQYASCGPFGICNFENSSRTFCYCSNGFLPRDSEEWNRGNWSGGCVRTTDLECERGSHDGFLKLVGIKLPDRPFMTNDSSEEDCHNNCFSNCSCEAYSYATTSDTSTRRCLVWTGPLLDMSNNFSTVLNLRLARSELVFSAGGRKMHSYIYLPAISALSLLLLGVVLCYVYRHIIRSKAETYPYLSFVLSGSKHTYGSMRSTSNEKRGMPNELPVFHIDIIATATNNFVDTNKLGEGGFGTVYKGRLPSGEEIAVKRLSKRSFQGLEEFKNEVELIANLQHRNLVRLLGCCVDDEEKMLIYEYLPNTSLDKFLFGSHDKRAQLDWKQRFCIIEGIAQGLLYLHRHSRLKIIHRDLKASNILLDGNMNPKISDFGMARIFGGDQREAHTKKVMGTFGYISPEYALNGIFSEKSDVYSFGVLMLEIVSGKRNTGYYLSNHSFHLLGLAWEMLKEGQGMNLLDSVLVDCFIREQVTMCVNLSLLCVQEDPQDRPTMSFVVSTLSSTESANLPVPKLPAFCRNRSEHSRDSSSVDISGNTNTEFTVTIIHPR